MKFGEINLFLILPLKQHNHKNYLVTFNIYSSVICIPKSPRSSPDEIREICNSVGITSESIVYIYCFKGSRAANILIALEEAGISARKFY